MTTEKRRHEGKAESRDSHGLGGTAKLREDLVSSGHQVKPLSLDEAISHADEVAGDCGTACKREHKQLADWLRELKDRRDEREGETMTNGEKYKTVDERTKAFRRFCRTARCESCPCFVQKQYVCCQFRWLDLEAGRKRHPKPCPFCGCKNVSVASNGIVQCAKCGAKVYADTQSKAIAAWNKRTK